MAEALPAPPPDAPAATPRWGLGEVVVGLAVAIAGAGLASSLLLTATGRSGERLDDLPLSLVALGQLGLWAGLLGVPIWAARTKGCGALEDFSIRLTGRDVAVGGLSGALLQIPVLPLLYGPILWLLDRTVEDLEGPARTLTDKATDPVGVLLLVLIVGIGAPVVEEVFYRGLFLGALRKRGLPPWLAIGVSSLAFGAMHLQPLQMPALVLFGVLAGTLTHLTGRLGPAIAAHVAFNMVTVTMLLLVA